MVGHWLIHKDMKTQAEKLTEEYLNLTYTSEQSFLKEDVRKDVLGAINHVLISNADKLQAKIKVIEGHIVKASTEPIGFSIYDIEGWQAQVAILKELITEL